jgi:Rieske Fe-S protein
VQFQDNNSGPGWLVHEGNGDFRAFSAICTHAGCTVGYDTSAGFVCPCHGGRYDASTGAVISGPPPAPLPGIPVTVADGDVRLT